MRTPTEGPPLTVDLDGVEMPLGVYAERVGLNPPPDELDEEGGGRNDEAVAEDRPELKSPREWNEPRPAPTGRPRICAPTSRTCSTCSVRTG